MNRLLSAIHQFSDSAMLTNSANVGTPETIPSFGLYKTTVTTNTSLSNLLSQQKQTLDLHSGKFSSAQF
jgi:hypothetical protein